MASPLASRIGLIPPLILVAVASFGVWRHIVHDQSSWSGASFGMFATIDNESTRQIRGYLVDSGGATPEPPPSPLRRETYEVLALPTEDRLERLAQRWAENLGRRDVDLLVEVWGADFDASTGVMSRFLINEVRIEH